MTILLVGNLIFCAYNDHPRTKTDHSVSCTSISINIWAVNENKRSKGLEYSVPDYKHATTGLELHGTL